MSTFSRRAVALAAAITWSKQNMADLTQQVENVNIRLTKQGTQYPEPSGSLPSIRFVGAGFSVRTREELERLARIEGASAIEPSEHPGGGHQVALRDPSGVRVEIVHCQAPKPSCCAPL